MSKNLIIVESPGKIKTLSKFLGKEFIVEASKGHVIDLPPSRFGVSTDNGFVPDFHVVEDRKDVILNLQKIAKTVDKVYLAPDPDREGEAISWHLANVLNIDPLSKCRITFNAITKEDVLKSLESPRCIDCDLVNAQQSRRILDRLVGYKLSPLLWQKICLGLSAGRVQSVAVALICQREKEILDFVPEEYWTIDADLKTDAQKKFKVRLTKVAGKKADVANKAAAESIVAALKAASLSANAVTKRERRQAPPPPFITSTLQAEAAQKFGFAPKRTMSIAQKLYEGIELGAEGQVGLITYMRTDSVRISPEGLRELNSFIAKNYSKEYQLDKNRFFKLKKGAQDAHEAIRPTSVFRTPEMMARFLKPEQLKIYSLIWKRYTASQMADAVYDVVTVDVEAGGNLFQASGTTMTFDGFTSLYSYAKDEETETDEFDEEGKQKLPAIKQGEKLSLVATFPEQHYTAAPPRYSESSIIKTLEKEGIGRPSTYATIVDTIQQRKYVKKVDGHFIPSDAAFVVSHILEANFKDLISTDFTAKMESSLDLIEEGTADWVKVLSDFYGPFSENLKKAEEEVEKVRIESDIVCPECGKKMVVRIGSTGKFLACSSYPECKSTINIPDNVLLFAKGIPQPPMKMAEILANVEEEEPEIELIDEKCEKCGAQMQIRSGKFGKFVACSNYPECKNTHPIVKDTGVKCPICGGKIVEKKSKRGRLFFGCSNYPKCTLTTWNKPTGELCPDCKAPLVWYNTKKLGDYVKCSAKGCKYKHIPESKGAHKDGE